MPTTQIFKSGNSLALRIPKALDFAKEGEKVEIERVGNELRIRLAEPRTLSKLMDKFAAFGEDFLADGRPDQEQHERETL